MGNSRILLAEALGTAILVIGGVGTAVFDAGRAGVLGVAIAFGMSLLCAACLIGPISGCHINPAITTAMVLVRRTDVRQLPAYLGGQVVGGLFGAQLVFGIAHGHPGFTATGTGGRPTGQRDRLRLERLRVHSPDHYSLGAVILAEAVATAVFALIVVGTTVAGFPVGVGGIVAGVGLALVDLVTIPVSNTAVNPARSIATAVFQHGWALRKLWVFIVFPLVGGAVAGLIGRAFLQIESAATATATA